MSLPKITLEGRLVADPELRFLPSGQAVCKFRLACDNHYKQGDNWVKGETLFLDVQSWGLRAEIDSALGKGLKVKVEGRLGQRSYTATDGTKRTVYEVTAFSTERVVVTAAVAADPGAYVGEEEPSF